MSRTHLSRRRGPILRASLIEVLESRQLLNSALDIDTVRAPVRTWSKPGQYLTGPAQTVSQAIDAALKAVQDRGDKLGLISGDLSAYRVTNQYTDADTGTSHVYLRQQYNGLDIVDADLNLNLDKAGRLINVGSSFVSEATIQTSSASLTRQYLMPLTEALAQTAGQLGLALTGTPLVTGGLLLTKMLGKPTPTKVVAPSLSIDDIPAKLTYVLTKTGLRLAWNFVFRTPDQQHWYNVSTDGATGRLVHAADWVEHASYTVFPRTVESPSHGSRSTLTDPQNATASPFGWHDTNGVTGAEFTDTRGNNVDAHTDLNDDDVVGANEAPRPTGGSGLVFNPSFTSGTDPSTYRSMAQLQLFYANNTAHDVHYAYGFTEAAGNFQTNDYGRGGVGGDAVQADAQDGATLNNPDHLNNANFFTPPDGEAPRMQMYLFDSTTPDRDGDLDNGVIFHEYGHGVSTRLTGGAANSDSLNATQSGGMGEGWSDFWALMFTQVSTDTISQAYPIGTYVNGQSPTGTGIRRKPYSYNMSVNNQTFGLYNSSQEVHDAGELWTDALWDMNWLLIQKYGFSSNIQDGYSSANPKGNTLALKLVMDALKLQPANPRFTDARDAILQADLVLTGGANQSEIWQAFARRGLGYSADAGSTADATTITEAYDVPSNSSIAGVVFTDPNANGVKNISETGLPNVRVYVDSNNNNVYDAPTTPLSQTHTQSVTVAIPDSQTITSSLSVSGRSNVVTDVNVKINITHTAVQDLIVTLISPSGKRVTLASREGPPASAVANFTNTVFDDSATTAIADGTAPYTGTFRPRGPLSTLVGENPNGTWKLEVSDNDVNDSGTLNNWSIALSTGVVGEKNTLTNSSGAYTLGSLPPGSYKIRQVVPAGYLQTLPASNGSYVIALATNQSVTGKDFGNKQDLGATIAGTVFYDANGNTTKDAGEIGLAGWTVFLDSNNNGLLDVGVTKPFDLTGLPSPIPDGGTLTRIIPVTGFPGNVIDLNVKFSITHPFDGDLSAYLTNPTGTRVQLFSSVGAAGDNFTSTALNDEAANPVGKGSAPFSGSFKPQQALSAFDGKVMNGNWTLEVTDNSPGDVGTLTAFSLFFTTTAGERTRQTDASGNYLFPNVPPGTQHVREIMQGGFSRTTPASGVYDFSLATNQSVTGKSFGNRPIPSSNFSTKSFQASTLIPGPDDTITGTVQTAPNILL